MSPFIIYEMFCFYGVHFINYKYSVIFFKILKLKSYYTISKKINSISVIVKCSIVMSNFLNYIQKIKIIFEFFKKLIHINYIVSFIKYFQKCLI